MPAEPVSQPARPPSPPLTRRETLGLAIATAAVAILPQGADSAPGDEPWSDGTLWSDGTGWTG
jgi:hypothetical protein